MSKVSKKSVQMIGRIALAAPLLLGAVAISLANQGGPARQSLAPSTSPVPSEGESNSTSAPKVTVNGESVPVDENGSANVTMHQSDSKVTISSGHSTVTKEHSTSSSSSASPAGNSDNVQVQVDSTSAGGNNWGTTQVFGQSFTSNGNSTSFSSTNVFSAGSNHVNVTSP